MRTSHPDAPFELRGAVRLASKYLLDDARADMIRRVTMDWPLTIDDWDICEGEREGLVRVWRDQRDRNVSSQFVTQRTIAVRTLEPVSAIVFAQEHGCTGILPAAFYRLASIDISAEWELRCYSIYPLNLHAPDGRSATRRTSSVISKDDRHWKDTTEQSPDRWLRATY